MLARSLLLCIALLTSGSAIAQQNIPITSFNQMPAVQQPSVSPDGKNIAVITNQGDNTQISVLPYDDPRSIKTLLALGGDKYRIESIDWANNERLIVKVTQPFKADGIPLRTTHLYSASIDGKSVFELNKRSKEKGNWNFYRARPELLNLLPKEKDHILVTIRDKRDGYYSSVFKVNVNSGDFRKYLPNKNKITGWYFNRLGEVLMAQGTDDNYKTDIAYYYTRKDTKSDWTLVKKVESYENSTFSPKLYEPETDSIIVVSDHKLKKDALWRYFIKSGKYELMGEAPGELDISGPIWRRSADVYSIIGFRYTDNFEQRVYFDEKDSGFRQQVRDIFTKNNLSAFFYSSDEAQQRFIVSAISDNKAPQFFLFDRAKNKLSPWYGQYPALGKVQLARVTPFEFTARDKMKLNGYITLPDGVKNPPLVLFPHGGPYGVRDYQYFDPFVQLIASRGYAVLQVNYRGSGGFGNLHLTKGYGEWGKAMQTDLMDAVNWVEKNKLADVNNACIGGISYGGYAALAAGYQTPKQFKCIVSIAGVGDMDAQINFWKRRSSGKSYIKNAVNESGDSMDPISPQFHASKFEVPVLLIHGKVDTRVSYRQSENMYDALRKADKDVELKLFKYGTHNLNDAANRKQAMKLMVDFLDKHLK